MVDGAIVVDTGTLTVQAQEADAAPRVVVSGRDQLLNSHSYAANRTPGDKWSSDETENFYNVCALSWISALTAHKRSPAHYQTLPQLACVCSYHALLLLGGSLPATANCLRERYGMLL